MCHFFEVADPSLHDSMFPFRICSLISLMWVNNWHVAMSSSSHGCRSLNIGALLLSGLGTVLLVILKFLMVLKLPFVSNTNDGYPLAC